MVAGSAESGEGRMSGDFSRFHQRTRTGFVMKPHGCCDETAPQKLPPIWFHQRTRERISRFHQRATISYQGMSPFNRSEIG